jgi:hypothetical protein
MGDVVQVVEEKQDIDHQVKEWLKDNVETPKHPSVTKWLETRFGTPEQVVWLSAALRDLDAKVTAGLGNLADDTDMYQLVVPPTPPTHKPTKDIKLRLWQLGFEKDASVKGPSNLVDIKEIITRSANQGTGMNTSKFNIEVVFGHLGLQEGGNIEDFRVGVSIGFGVTTACYCICLNVILSDIFSKDYAEFQKLCPLLRTCLRPCGLYDPAPTKMLQAFKSVGGKMAATNRQRPNVLQLLDAFRPAVEEMHEANRKKGKSDLFGEVAGLYNKQEKVRKCKIFQDELDAIKFVSKRNEAFTAQLQYIWGTEKVNHTALPINLLSSAFLTARYTIPVPKATHAVWHDIMTPTEEKYCAWLSRVQGRFERKVADTIARGKAPNLRNYGSMYRDAEPEIVWRLACWWVWLLPHMKANHSAARVLELTTMFYAGALDKDMYDKVKYLDPNASADQVRFVRTEDVKGLEEKESAANNDVESAEQAEKEAVFNTFKSKLGREQTTFKFYGERKREYEAVTQGLLTEARHAMPMAVPPVKSMATTPAPTIYNLWPKRNSINLRFKRISRPTTSARTVCFDCVALNPPFALGCHV